ncbi:uncharacterized protein PV09_09742 [Verruconis gallopava]|uniref:5'-deoxynucleotidase n=1 Tax=Verruconis gallopava TaxID=253628 RepID=A0A0D1ZWQ1_9PEZI|nr:uncharacterized protein PV09_09742 [Verruconis gallopava]KIV98444.1 hypothetical protein PV09_09742 [Verruconis gallopava]
MDNFYQLLELIEQLKIIKRSGWKLRGIHEPESVADHTFRVALICLIATALDDEKRKRAVYMALIHDMGEAIIGDITPSDGISPEQKYIREEMAIKFQACTIRKTHPDFADMMLGLWHEYEEGKTDVAIFVRQADKVEAAVQGVIYEERTGIDMRDFMKPKVEINVPELKDLMQTCQAKRTELQSRREMSNKIKIIFVSGAPGIGKGTQCKMLAKDLGFCHLSAGDLLRNEANDPESPYADFINESMRKSVLIPPQLTTQLLKREITRALDEGKERFLLDGFPRSLDQLHDFELKICDHYSTLSFECKDDIEILQQRLIERAKSSGRVDDNPESIQRRLKTFEENNKPVLEYLRTHGHGVFRPIDCSGTISDVYNSVRSEVESIIRYQ